VLDAGLQVLGQRLVVLSDGRDRPVDGVTEGVSDVLALVTSLAELAAFGGSSADGTENLRQLVLDLFNPLVIPVRLGWPRPREWCKSG
jgi:hypothetical protein